MISSYIWSPEEGTKFILNTVNEGRVTLFSFDFEQREHIDTCYKNLTNDDNAYDNPIYIYNGVKNMIIDYSSFKRATLLGILTLNEQSGLYECQVLYDANEKEMEQYEMIDPEWFTFIGANNDRIQGWIMKPINYVEGKKYPLAYLIHGGPEGAWEPAWSYRWNPNLWANHGFAVLMINPHGSSGMGIDFQNAVRYNWGGWPFEDIMKGLDFAINNYNFIDKDRVGGCGASYGGFMINWIQGHNDENETLHRDWTFNCLANHDGIFSAISMYYGTEEIWFPKEEFCDKNYGDCNPWEGKEIREWFEQYSPERFTKNWNTPMIIIHGGTDYRVSLTEGLSSFTTLQLKGIPSEFLFLHEENHWCLKPENQIKWYDRVYAFFDNYTQSGDFDLNEDEINYMIFNKKYKKSL